MKKMHVEIAQGCDDFPLSVCVCVCVQVLSGVKESRLKNWLFNKAYQSKQAEVQRYRLLKIIY